MKKHNWGILATGKIANTFAKALVFEPNAVPYAVASRTIEKAEKFAAEYGFEKAYGSYAELAADENVEVVYIASPMSCHYADAKLCLEHGKNVLCEKSITLNTAELDELLALAKAKNVFFMEAMWMKCLPSFRKALEWYNDGKIGEIRMSKSDFCGNVSYDENDRLFRKSLGGGALLDLGVYNLTFITAFHGFEPESITSFAHIGQSDVDFDASVLLKYDGSFAAASFGFDLSGRNNATIVGSNGKIEFGDWFFCTHEVRLYDKNGILVEEFNEPHKCNGYENEVIEVQHCLDNGLKESPLNPMWQTKAIMGLMDKCRKDWGFKYLSE